MSETEQIWFELHDLEKRAGRVEDELVREDALSEEHEENASERRDQMRFVISTAVATGSTVALVLSLFHVF